MGPPSYQDLGKTAKDLINKGFSIGTLKVDVKNRVGYDKQHEFSTQAFHDIKTEALNTNINFKYKILKYDTTLIEKWNSKNVFSTIVELNNQFADGLKICLESNYNMKDNSRTAFIKSDYTTPDLKFNNKVSLLGVPTIKSYLVIAHKDILLGFQVITNIDKMKIKSTNMCVSKVTPYFILTGYANNRTTFGGSIFHKASSNLELGAEVSFNSVDKKCNYTLAGKYNMSPDLTLKGKINNDSCISMAVKHKVNNSLALTGTSQFSLISSHRKSHKIGFGIEYSS
uniref:Voltage-dependent anion-selective channel protein 3 n=1 Tax=Parastrongyloides trichosuri TaxID=131310 RepID=A0A0N5A3H7_PARTI